jgi:hypothetical protein
VLVVWKTRVTPSLPILRGSASRAVLWRKRPTRPFTLEVVAGSEEPCRRPKSPPPSVSVECLNPWLLSGIGGLRSWILRALKVLICRPFARELRTPLLLAMQKVEGSNPFSRSLEGLHLQVFFVRAVG